MTSSTRTRTREGLRWEHLALAAGALTIPLAAAQIVQVALVALTLLAAFLS